MRSMERSVALVFGPLAWGFFIAVGACDDKPQATSPPVTQAPRPGGHPWLTDLVHAQAEAVRLRRPILVRLGAEWCPWCRKLDAEFARPEVQHVLGSWTLVAVDVDRDHAAAESLGAASIPALRVMTPAGRLVASREGFLSAGELIAWLGKHQAGAADLPLSELADSGAPGAVGVVRLVRQLDQTDALLREAAALAGFALALLGEAEGLKPLLSYRRTHPGPDEAWNQRAYQAIAQVDDDSQVPVLEQIYAKARSDNASSAHTQRFNIKDLYWTIRVMDGPNARRLRQRIRREVGMPFLRGEQSPAM